MSKGLIYTVVAIVLLTLSGCGASRVVDLRGIDIGMTKDEVIRVIGLPDRSLAITATEDGLQEVLEFRTYYNEVYAVEFINNRLVGYEFLYDDTPAISSGAFVPVYPVYHNSPVYPVQPNRPTKPNRPSRPSRPTENRPSRPEINRPTEPVRPSGNSGTTRPLDKDNGSGTTRPSSRGK